MSDVLGKDILTDRIAIEAYIVISGLAVMLFFFFNTTAINQAMSWMLLGIVGALMFVFAFVLNRKAGLDYNLIIARENLLKLPQKYAYLIYTGVFLFTFFFMANSSYRVASPTLQVINTGIGGDIILALWGAIYENIFFFVGIPALISSLIYWKTKNVAISLIPSAIITPIIFAIYHINVYGISSVETWAVMLFGIEMMIAMIILRDITYIHVRHVANNLGILVFATMDIQTFMIMMTSSWLFWVAIIITGVLAVNYIRKR